MHPARDATNFVFLQRGLRAGDARRQALPLAEGYVMKVPAALALLPRTSESQTLNGPTASEGFNAREAVRRLRGRFSARPRRLT